MTIDLFIALSGILIIVLTLLPFWRVGSWWVRIFDFPCAQLAFFGVMIVFAWLFLYLQGEILFISTRMIPFLVGSLLIQVYRIYPYTIFVRKDSPPPTSHDPDQTVSILAANVLMKNRNHNKLLKLIKKYDPDLVLLTEANRSWEQAMKSLETTYRFTLKKPLENTYGMLMYSRLPLLECEIKFLVEDDVPSLHATVRLPAGDTVDVYGLHPRPPRVNQDVHERDAELLMVGRSIASRQRPAIIAGDLNDVAWSHSTRLFRRLSGLLDPRIGRGFFNTFPTHVPFFRFPMDHIFHSEHMRVKRLQVLEAFGSDHYPIFVSLHFVTDNLRASSTPKEVWKEAQEKIDEVLEQGQNESLC